MPTTPHRPDRARRARSTRGRGTTATTPISAASASSAVSTKIEPQEKPSSSAPDASRPSVPPVPAKPAQMPTALARSSGGNTLVIVDSVPGMISAAPMPIDRAVRDEHRGRVRGRGERGRAAEEHEPDDQRAPPAVAVAERAGGQEQRGEGERVRVDDPLLLRLARAEVLGDRGQAVGEHRHSGHDHHQREAHDREDQVAVAVRRPVRGFGRVRARVGKGLHGWPSLRGAGGGSADGDRWTGPVQ